MIRGTRDETERRLTSPRAPGPWPPWPWRIGNSTDKGLAFHMEEFHIRKGFPQSRDTATTLPGITDVHVHVEPYRSLKPLMLDMLWREIPDRQPTSGLMDDPRAFLEHLDGAGVERACLINYVSPEVMGFA